MFRGVCYKKCITSALCGAWRSFEVPGLMGGVPASGGSLELDHI